MDEPALAAGSIAADLPTASRLAGERGVPVLVFAGWARERCPPVVLPEMGRVADGDWTVVTPEVPEVTLRLAPLGSPKPRAE